MMFMKLTAIAAAISIAFIANTAFAQGGPPPGGGGAAPTTLDVLGCGPTEIARVNTADEWECSADLTANEAAAQNAQDTADRAIGNAATAQSTANTAQETAFIALDIGVRAEVTAFEAQEIGNNALIISNDALNTVQAAVVAAGAAQITADEALAVGNDALSRVEILEGQGGQNVELRIVALEEAVFPISPIPGGNLAGLNLGSHTFQEPIDVDGFAPGVNFAGTVASGFARFVRTDLRGANFSGIGGTATWTFEFTDIRGVNFSGATARAIRLTASDNRGVSFVGAVLGRQGVTLGDNSGGFRGDSRDMDFRNTRINGPLIGMNSGDRSDFSGSVWFSNGSFSTGINALSCRECKFNGVDFSGWTAFGTSFELILRSAQDTEWRGANLAGLRFKDTGFQRADFRDANLQNALFVNMNFEGALFSGANLAGVDWTNAICPDGVPASTVGGTCDFNLID